jgi:hypothetical protein
MFDSLQEAIDLADGKRNNDGGVPLFYNTATAYRKGEDVEYIDEVWVKIFNKGDPKNIMERPLREEDKKRWPEHWKAFLANEDPEIDGIPLSDFPKMTPAERARCKQLHLLSVEDLVNYPDGQIKDLGSRGHELQRAAKEFLEYKSGASVQELKDEIEELKRKLASVTDSIKDDSKRSSGSKSSKASVSDDSGSGLSGESGSDS